MEMANQFSPKDFQVLAWTFLTKSRSRR